MFVVTNAQTIDLGTAAGFAVLGASTVTNSDPSVLNGDLGVFPGTAITGFPPGVVNGATYTGGVAQIAQDDALTAYNVAAGVAYSAGNDLTGQDLGGKTLVPGVYHYDSSAGLTGALTLDGNGDPNSVFVFQIGSTLITGTNAVVALTNGAQACNVFWQVGSSATIDTATLRQSNQSNRHDDDINHDSRNYHIHIISYHHNGRGNYYDDNCFGYHHDDGVGDYDDDNCLSYYYSGRGDYDDNNCLSYYYSGRGDYDDNNCLSHYYNGRGDYGDDNCLSHHHDGRGDHDDDNCLSHHYDGLGDHDDDNCLSHHHHSIGNHYNSPDYDNNGLGNYDDPINYYHNLFGYNDDVLNYYYSCHYDDRLYSLIFYDIFYDLFYDLFYIFHNLLYNLVFNLFLYDVFYIRHFHDLCLYGLHDCLYVGHFYNRFFYNFLHDFLYDLFFYNGHYHDFIFTYYGRINYFVWYDLFHGIDFNHRNLRHLYLGRVDLEPNI
ncbi:hypothetical protein A1O3_07756 [Capronia epimyces CBS 606.96]|uniref:DUF3494 domain-containing protein n=1 Tax=Capronia epimyces CBS 606.96 TaxID=1182542 RepID=W9YGQ9_9EURO|nr:uncharacterized protein A1O3_07756 [Capronia epimyces CBS 606.96]EXJ81464.1 hypothetical protein A1O3_07756 [Capronia epimyces CBS 606.96]